MNFPKSYIIPPGVEIQYSYIKLKECMKLKIKEINKITEKRITTGPCRMQARLPPAAWEARGGGTPYNGLHGEAPPERSTFFRLQVYKKVGISQVEVYKRVGKLVN